MGEKSASLENKWTFGPDVPTYDYFEGRDVRKTSDLEWLINDLIEDLERDHFLQWEAVVCQELGLHLTERQREAIGELLNFGDESDDDRIHYINGIPRPDRLWYEIVRTVTPLILVPQFKTLEIHYSVTTDGWKDLADALEQYGEGLSLPNDAELPVEVVPEDLRHKLWLQWCFVSVYGVGQHEELTLRNPAEHYRVAEFIDHLREHKESVEFLDLTLETLLKSVILPPQDEPIFIDLMRKQLGLGSMQDKLADRLS